jgi:predicted metal-dependent phosphoesterase TrpH/glycosyltransferase involved in cell wall biosynthesis
VPLAIAQVTPHAWEDADQEVNRQVARVADELSARGHRVLIIAPSRDPDLVREGRAAVRAAPLPEPGAPPRVLAVGETLPELPSARRPTTLPVDVTRTIEALHDAVGLDVCHVHEPFAPSTSSAALRHSRALNVGTFHAPTERLLSTQLGRRVVERVFGRLDARLASFAATAEVTARLFGGTYRTVLPGADVPRRRQPRAPGSPVHLAFVDAEERAALRLFLRALRAVPGDWRATLLTDRPPTAPLPPGLRERVRIVARGTLDEPALMADADVVVAASDGLSPAPMIVLRALAGGAVPVAADLPVYRELLAEGERGLLFGAREVDTLAGRLARLVADAQLRAQLAAAPRPDLGWSRVAGELEEVYGDLVARRHPTAGDPAVRARLRGRRRIDVDLHMHTDHSPDCATPVEVLLATARAQGLGAIAVTDHNVISGAIEAREKADRFGMKVIVGEEVKTAGQGEVIGLFLRERIPRGLSLEETVAEIRRQGGVVYVPHPFDRLHSVPDYEHLLAILDDIDAIEIYNPRVAIGAFNEEAERFAAKYRVLAGAGSDAHVARGLGSVRVRVPDFDGPEEFREALREAEILTKPSSLLYVQALKFLETTAIPPAARRARRDRRVRRASRKA